MENKRVKRRMRPGCLFSIVIVILGAIILFLTPLFSINKITVEGNGRVSDEKILAASGIKTKQSIFKINVRNAENKIEDLQYIEQADVKRNFPNKVTITVKEGKVAAYILAGKNILGINMQGETVCYVQASAKEVGAPLVKGLTITKKVMGEKIEVKENDKLEILLKLMDTLKDREMLTFITEINLKDKNDIILMYMDKLKIKFGDTKRYDIKFDQIQGMLEKKMDVGQINLYGEKASYSPNMD